MAQIKNFCFLDLETTGLNPGVDGILEIAAIITDTDFNVLSTYHRYLSPTGECADYLDLPFYNNTAIDFVKEMHNASGLYWLWRDAERIDYLKASLELHKFIVPYLGEGFKSGDSEFARLPLAGSSVHFDEAFLKAEFDTCFTGYLDHQHLNISAIRLFLNTLKPNLSDKYRRDVIPKHMALNDILSDINWIKNFKTMNKKWFDEIIGVSVEADVELLAQQQAS